MEKGLKERDKEKRYIVSSSAYLSTVLNASSLPHSPPSFYRFPPFFCFLPSHLLPFSPLGGKIIMRSEIGNPGGTKSAVRTCLSVRAIYNKYMTRRHLFRTTLTCEAIRHQYSIPTLRHPRPLSFYFTYPHSCSFFT